LPEKRKLPEAFDDYETRKKYCRLCAHLRKWHNITDRGFGKACSLCNCMDFEESTPATFEGT